MSLLTATCPFPGVMELPPLVAIPSPWLSAAAVSGPRTAPLVGAWAPHRQWPPEHSTGASHLSLHREGR